MNGLLPKTRVIGHALFHDAGGRVLFLEVGYKSEWELPGGVVEPHESPRVGAEREVVEELGIEARLGRVLVIDWLPPYLGWDDAVELIFDGGILDEATSARFVLRPGEILAAHWVEPAEAAEHLIPLAARRLLWLAANPGAPTAYFEDGRSA